MCGFLSCFGKKPTETLLEQGLQALAPRGPDDKGIYEDSLSWMGFRRLSILDLSHLGHQPMLFDDGRYVLVFNGEIYNYRELRSTYLRGVDIQSSGDTETLGHLLQIMPVEKLLPKLRGMFAFVWYDKFDRKVTAARDPFGIKPIYYNRGTNHIYCASELKALMRLGISKELNLQGIRDYFGYGSVQSPNTIMKDICLLPSGHMLSWESERGIEVKKWYEPQWRRKDEWIGRDSQQLMEISREIILGSIKAHLLSDVEVGVFLSSGIDSSLIACGMKYLGQSRIKAFSIGYDLPNKVGDERSAAKRTASFLGAEFESETVTGTSVLAFFDDYIRAMDQPTGDALNTYLVSKLAGHSVKVAMSGVGIDEWLGGYNFHKVIKAAESLRKMGIPISKCASIAELLLEKGYKWKNTNANWKVMHLCKLVQFGEMRGMQNYERTFFTQSDFHNSLLLKNISTEPPFSDPQELDLVAPDSVINKLFALETKTYLRNTLLRDSDWSSMAHSLELRTPFIDKEVFNVLAFAHPDQKLRFGSTKRLLRECFADILPPWILEENRKKTFTLPKGLWMKEPRWSLRIKGALLDRRFIDRGIITPEVVQGYLSSFYTEKDGSDLSYYLSQKIWMLFILEEWLRAHVD